MAFGLSFLGCSLSCAPVGAREGATPTVASGGKTSIITSPADGYLGSRNDEERSEMRYVMRIAEFSESSRF